MFTFGAERFERGVKILWQAPKEKCGEAKGLGDGAEADLVAGGDARDAFYECGELCGKERELCDGAGGFLQWGRVKKFLTSVPDRVIGFDDGCRGDERF